MSKEIWNDDGLTSYKPEQPIISGPSRRTRLRHWLIKKLAGSTSVMINIKVSHTFHLPRGETLFHNVEIAYPKIAIFDHDVRQGTIITHPEGTFITVRNEEPPR